jgi:hypothetical protein
MHFGQGESLAVTSLKKNTGCTGVKDPCNTPRSFGTHTENPVRIAVAAFQHAIEILRREERGGNHGSLGGAFHEL